MTERIRSAKASAERTTRHLGVLVCGLTVLASSPVVLAQDTIVRAGRVLDGRGAVLENASIRIRDGRIVAVGPLSGSSSDTTHDLGDLTVLPGLTLERVRFVMKDGVVYKRMEAP